MLLFPRQGALSSRPTAQLFAVILLDPQILNKSTQNK